LGDISFDPVSLMRIQSKTIQLFVHDCPKEPLMELPHIANFRGQKSFFDGAQMLNQSVFDRTILLIWFDQ
jgi:hypothetical protein